MVFGGFQKLTLLDYPGKVACTLFTVGCNFRCPFCHNSFLVDGEGPERIDESEILHYLKKRQGILEGVCISGGEPLVQNDIESFMKKVKALGYSLKLDTNGSYPQKLKALVDEGLVDYVAMDVKNTFSKYPATSGRENIDIEDIKSSIDFLISSGIEYEFRTTVTAELHTPEDIFELSGIIKGAKRYFIQNFVDSGNVLGMGLSPVSSETLLEMRNRARENVANTQIRGTDI